MGHFFRLCLIIAGLLLFSEPSSVRAQQLRAGPEYRVVPEARAAIDYWIISSRKIDPRLGCGPNGSNLYIYRVQGEGGHVSSMNELVASLAPGEPVCLMTHGSFVTWESMCRDSRGTHDWLREACPNQRFTLICHTWPSDDPVCRLLPGDVYVLGKRAARHGLIQAQIIGMIPPSHPISLIGHSHGARLVMATAHLLNGGCVESLQLDSNALPNHRIRAVIAAAAADHHWLNPGEMYECAMTRAEGWIHLVNPCDLALAFYPFHRFFARSAISRTGLTDWDINSIGPESQRFVEYDVSSIVGTNHNWPNYYCQPAIARTIGPFVTYSDQAGQIPHAAPVLNSGQFPASMTIPAAHSLTTPVSNTETASFSKSQVRIAQPVMTNGTVSQKKLVTDPYRR